MKTFFLKNKSLCIAEALDIVLASSFQSWIPGLVIMAVDLIQLQLADCHVRRATFTAGGCTRAPHVRQECCMNYHSIAQQKLHFRSTGDVKEFQNGV